LAASPTACPAVTHPCVSRQQGRLLLLSAGRRLPSVVVQAAVHSQHHCSTCILRQAFGAHHSASPRTSLAAGSGTDNIPSLHSDTYFDLATPWSVQQAGMDDAGHRVRSSVM